MPKQKVPLIDGKQIGKIKAKFKTEKDGSGTDRDKLYLTTYISDDFKKLLKECIIDETTVDSYNDGETGQEFVRYKVKRWVLNSLYYGRQFLFSKKLIEDGEETLSFSKAQQVESHIDCFKENMKRIVEVVFKYGNIDVTIEVNLPTGRRRK